MKTTNNDFNLIMENWRHYSAEVLQTIPKISPEVLREDRVLLFESDTLVPNNEVSLGELLEQWDSGEITSEQYTEIVERSTEYECNELLEEGLTDILRSAMNATIFRGKSEEEIAEIKKKAREKIANFVVIKLWVRASAYLRKQFQKINKSATVFLNDAKQAKISQSKMGKIAKSVMGGMGKVAVAIGKLVAMVAKFGLSVLGHPITKWIVVVLCALILVVAMFNSAVFIGALGFAPAFAAKRLGTKAGTKLAGASIKAALYEEARLLREFDVVDMLNTAVSEILSTMPESGEHVTEVAKEFFMSTTVEGGETESFNSAVTMIKRSDVKLHQSLNAVRTLQRAAAEGSLEALDMSMVGEETKSIITNAIEVAKAVCEADDAYCTAAGELIADFNEWDSTEIHAMTEKTAHMKTTLGEFEGSKEFHGISHTVRTDTFVNPLGAEAGSAADISGQGGEIYTKTKGAIGKSVSKVAFGGK